MRRIISIFLLSVAMVASVAWAGDEDQYSGSSSDTSMSSPDDSSDTATSEESTTTNEVETESQDGQAAGEVGITDESEPGIAGEDASTGVTAREEGEVSEGGLANEIIGFKPQVGAVVFKDRLLGDETSSRAAYGFTVDANVMRAIDPNLRNWYIGPSTGLIYSHLGASDSNFFGTDSTSGAGNSGANFIQIPADLKVGYNISDNFRVAAHGGGNVTYRSVTQSMLLSSDDVANGGDSWSMYPNVGADFEFGLGKNVALMLRPDWTLAPEDDLFVGTLALAIPLG